VLRYRSVVAALVLVAALPFQAPVGAWNERGHMLVAFIAFNHLTPGVKTEVGRLLELNPQFKTWTKNLPAGTTKEERTLAAFLQASIWPDFIKTEPKYVTDGSDNGNTPPPGPSAAQNIGYADLNRHKYWHFKDIAFSDDGTATVAPPAVNAQGEIELMRKALSASGTSDDVKSYDLVWLIHLVGDVHQPLHAVARFTKPHPAGDGGGNLLKLEKCSADVACEANLHSQWDRLLGMQTAHASVSKSANALDTKLNPPGGQSTEVATWIQESVDIAKADAYRTAVNTRLPAPKAFLTNDYLKRAGGRGQERVVLAGRRLATLINEALGHK
jgi:hypothetical protein